MDISQLKTTMDVNLIGNHMYRLISDLYPICRSITGNGVRETLDILKGHIPLEVHELSTGTKVFDWTVPKEWNIRDAYVANSRGERILDFRTSNLHVLNYSIPIKKNVSLRELKDHLFTLPEHPTWIPYRTSYYNDNWGFCLSHDQFLALENGEYEVCIDASLDEGYLTYGEYYVKGNSDKEVLISTHVCHPSLCNDNLSGISLATFLAKYLSDISLRFSYRFLFIPVTIGSIVWLAVNENKAHNIAHGLVLACVGDGGKFTYKKSRQGSAEIDRAAIHILKYVNKDHGILDFVPYGYDERQFCSPGFNLPVGCFMRTPHGCFPEYHTSADNLDFVRPSALGESFSTVLSILGVIENNNKYLNKNPKCEPQLGKRGLYRAIGGQTSRGGDDLAMLWILNFSDANHSLLDIAERSGLSFETIRRVADVLVKHGLLQEIEQ